MGGAAVAAVAGPAPGAGRSAESEEGDEHREGEARVAAAARRRRLGLEQDPAHLSGGRGQGGRRLPLPTEGRVQFDLQGSRELRIDRSDRPGHRRLDDSPGLRRWDGERPRQSRPDVERPPRREMPGHPGPL